MYIYIYTTYIYYLYILYILIKALVKLHSLLNIRNRHSSLSSYKFLKLYKDSELKHYTMNSSATTKPKIDLVQSKQPM